jgi:hypothetical protein
VRKPIFYYLFGFFTALGLGAMAVFPLAMFGSSLDTSGGNEYKIEQAVLSPDEAYAAVVYTGMGGGAAGWCAVRVAVLPKDEQFDPKKAAEYGDFIFDVSCGSDVALRWAEPRKLFVSYTGLEDKSGISVYMKPRSKDGEVKIEYQPVAGTNAQ